MPDSKSSSSILDDATEAWLREMEETHGPGAAYLSRKMAIWSAYEALALRFYQAIQQRQPPPHIADAVQRFYAWGMGQAVTDLHQAIDHKDRFWERAHRSAVSRIHSAIQRYQNDRDELGLPLDSRPDAIDTAAYYGRAKARPKPAHDRRSTPAPCLPAHCR
jgi:hypothetical protein